MVAVSFSKVGLVVAAAVLACGCAENGSLDLSTASIAPQQAKTDPICASLAGQINSLKADGTIGKLEEAADGKTAKVSVKRTALQKQAELNKAYEQFQSRCGPPAPAGQTAAGQTTAQPTAGQTASANK
jgi:hypothetical protein